MPISCTLTASGEAAKALERGNARLRACNIDIRVNRYEKERIPIDSIYFTTVVIELQAEDGTVFMTQHLYFRVIEDKECSVVISYMDETSGNTLLSSWKNPPSQTNVTRAISSRPLGPPHPIL